MGRVSHMWVAGLGRMRVGIVTPAPPGSRYGNRITSVRWARILRRLGNRVSILQTYAHESFDLLVALHARRSHQSIISFQRQNPAAPVLVALTGTDLYRDIRINPLAQESLDLATRIVVLQPRALDELPSGLRDKTRVIYQSVENNRGARSKSPKTKASKLEAQSTGSFDVCVIGHLRAVKDPFRTAMAARLLPASSAIRVLQVGGTMTDAMAARARKEMRLNERYQWLGEKSERQVRRILAHSQVCVISSRMEGGANVLSEAISSSVPILASRIDGNVGILGEEYPGYFVVGDTAQLARLLTRAESSPRYLAELKAWSASLAGITDPTREEQAWSELLDELSC
jgi:putative glycosyltransferase (TIGR04348 family)